MKHTLSCPKKTPTTNANLVPVVGTVAVLFGINFALQYPRLRQNKSAQTQNKILIRIGIVNAIIILVAVGYILLHR